MSPDSGDPAPEEMERARALVAGARRVLVLTGAGISAESGVPTFRGEDGLWRDHRPEDLATPEAFRRDPRLVWEWYGWRRELIRGCRPNPGHDALARWLGERGEAAALATQNVDGLHARAAMEAQLDRPTPVLELHGSLFRVRCTGCRRESPHHEPVDASSREALPSCPRCGSLLRPAVVWFGEPLPHDTLDEAVHKAEEADLALVVGTSAMVHPAAALPRLTLGAGGMVVEVNPRPSLLTPLAAISLRGAAGRILPLLLGIPGSGRV